MNGDVLIHAVEVKEYMRVLPNGKRVVVRGYRRQGNAAQEAMNETIRKVHAQGRVYTDTGRRNMQSTDPNVRAIGRQQMAEGNRKYREDYLRYVKNYQPTTAEVAKYAVTDAYENTKVIVGTIIEEAKFNAQVLGANIENAMPKVKEAINNGIQAVKSFFARLFGQKTVNSSVALSSPNERRIQESIIRESILRERKP